MKCLISLGGYLYFVHLPDGTFSSGTQSFPLDHLHFIVQNIFIENLRILAFEMTQCFQTSNINWDTQWRRTPPPPSLVF